MYSRFEIGIGSRHGPRLEAKHTADPAFHGWDRGDEHHNAKYLLQNLIEVSPKPKHIKTETCFEYKKKGSVCMMQLI